MLQGFFSGREVTSSQTLVSLKEEKTNISTDCNMFKRISIKHRRSETHLLKHERKLHSFLRHALHIQEAVEFKIEFPLAVFLTFLTASKSDG